MRRQFLVITIFTKRSFITLASLAAAMVAHAGSIQVTGTSADLTATTPGGSDEISSAPLTSYLDAYSSYFGAAESAVASAETTYSFNGTTLSGTVEATAVASAGQNGSATANAYVRHVVYFDLTSQSNVSVGLSADADTSVVQKKGGVAGRGAHSSVNVYKWDGSNYVPINWIENPDS